MIWTPPDLARAAVMWSEGQSGGVIASAFGVSRNSVAGMMNRNRSLFRCRGDGKSAVTIRGASGDRPAKAARAAAKPAACGREKKQSAPPAVSAPVPNLPAVNPMGFLEAALRGRCLHFIGDPMSAAGPDMPVCGGERSFAAPSKNRYCPYHIASAAQARAT